MTFTLDELISEVERYLDAVDVFRSEGCEPRWSGEEDLCTDALLDTSEPVRVSA